LAAGVVVTRAELAAALRAHADATAYDDVRDLMRAAADALAWPVGDVYRHERPEIGDWLEVELTGEVRANGWVEARLAGQGALPGFEPDPCHRGVIDCNMAIDPAALKRSWVRVWPAERACDHTEECLARQENARITGKIGYVCDCPAVRP
jgi:hypothetical protein